MHKLTVFKCLNHFRVARLTFDTSIEGRDEKFIFRVLSQIANDVCLARRTHHCHDIVFLRTATQVAEPNIQSLHEIKVPLFFIKNLISKLNERK